MCTICAQTNRNSARPRFSTIRATTQNDQKLLMTLSHFISQRNLREPVESPAVMRQPGPDPDGDEDHHQEHRDHADRMSPHLVHGAAACVVCAETPRPCRYATSASSSVLPF